MNKGDLLEACFIGELLQELEPVGYYRLVITVEDEDDEGRIDVYTRAKRLLDLGNETTIPDPDFRAIVGRAHDRARKLVKAIKIPE